MPGKYTCADKQTPLIILMNCP